MGRAKYTRDSAGYFQTKVWDGTYTEIGKKHRVVLRSRKSSADLERMVREFRSKVESGEHIQRSEKSFPEYAREWLITKEIYQNNTQRQYRDIIRYYIEPELAAVAISDIKKMHLQILISRNAEHPRTCQLIRRTFLQIAESAVDDRYLPENVLRPLRAVELPKYHKSERRILTAAEKEAIRTADLTPMQRCFIYLIYFCGLRRGEALAITPADIDLRRKTLRVCRAVEFINNASGIKDPKSQNGFRDVPLATQMVQFLGDYLQDLKSDYLVHNAAGGLMTQSAFRRMWESIIRKLNAAAGGTERVRAITGLTPHMFRHTFCTELCYQVPKISTKKIAQILGDDESMVIKVYSHIMEEKEDAPAALEEALSI